MTNDKANCQGCRGIAPANAHLSLPNPAGYHISKNEKICRNVTTDETEVGYMLLDIYIYPHPILLKKAEPVEVFDAELEKLASDMTDTMYEGNGVGLAAPQIGLSKRLFVVDTSLPEEPSSLKVYVNPKIILKENPIVWNEGCLSLPGLYRDVNTFSHVIIEAQDVHGQVFREEAHELRAVALLHEYSHLDGSVFIDRLSPLKRSLVKKSWSKHARRDAEKTYKDTHIHCVFDGPVL